MELGFRSPLLTAMPQSRYRIGELVCRLARHWAIFAVPATLLVLLVFSIDREWLPKHGLGLVLYRMHDSLFLHVKGYTYTLFHPWSWVWWGLLAFLLGLGLLSWLFDVRIVKCLHVRLVRWVIRQHRLHSPLLQGVRLYGKLGLRSKLVRVTADTEWQLAMLRLTRSRPGNTSLRLCQAASSLTALCLDLAKIPPADQGEAWQAREHWARAMLALHAAGIGAPDEKSEEKRHTVGPEARHRKGETFHALMANLVSSVDLPEPQEDQESRTPALELPRTFTDGILTDLHLLATLGKRKWDARSGETRPDQLLVGQLVRSSESRRRLLHDLCLHLEAEMRSPEYPWESTQEGLPQAGRAETCWPVAGSLAICIALHASLWADMPWIAAAFLDAVDSLRLLIQGAGERGAAIEDWRVLARDIPTDLGYRLVSQWMGNQLREDQRAWQSELSQVGGLAEGGDFELARSVVAAVERAIGPK